MDDNRFQFRKVDNVWPLCHPVPILRSQFAVAVPVRFLEMFGGLAFFRGQKALFMIAEDRQDSVRSGNLQYLDTVRAAIDEVANGDEDVPGSWPKGVNQLLEFGRAAMNVSNNKDSFRRNGQCLYPEFAHCGPR